MSGFVNTSPHLRWLRVAITAMVLSLMLLLAPTHALARDYSIDSVEIEATVQSDGSLVVKEAREFDFDGSFHGVYWRIPTGRFNGRNIETTILRVGEIIDGRFVEFELTNSGDEHTYQLSQYATYVEVKLYSSHDDERAVFGISYRDSDLASRYDDTSELYWKFVSDGWDVESQNVTCTVKLPIPDDAVVTPGQNVRAWGHGPLDASVAFSGNDIVYTVPGVGSSEFAEARIVFPPEWLSEVEPSGGSQLDTILAEEEQWANEANQRRARARMIMAGSSGISLAIPLASLAYAISAWLKYKRTHKAQFDDKYFRDVPSDDHPAVLGALLEGGSPTDECLTASIMRLTDQGYAALDLTRQTKKGLLGREKVVEDYSLTPKRWPERTDHETSAQRVDFETMRFLFDRLLRLSSRVTGNSDALMFGSLEKVARSYPESYDSHRKGWVSFVESECARRGFFIDDQRSGRWLVVTLCVLDILVSVGSFVLLMALGAPILMVLFLPALGVLSGIALAVMAATMKPLSSEAVELNAKLKALRNWLKDFTRLEEAIPQDVILWNRLLVMATVLGVSEEVIKQLKMVAPQLLDDPAMTTYMWYGYTRSYGSPARAFTEAASSAHSVSTAKIAASSDSSGGGGGGGFSGGGGGGFGGGGGGGAF